MRTFPFIAAALSIAAAASSVNAEPYTLRAYTVYTFDNGAYDNNQEQDVAVPLPVSMVKDGWSCVRQAVNKATGSGFMCSNGKVQFISHVYCPVKEISHDDAAMILKSDGVSFTFTSHCFTVFQ